MMHRMVSTAITRPHSSHSMPNTMSVSAAARPDSHPSPAPTPIRPPEAAAVSVCVCWKPAPYTSSQMWPQEEKRAATCGLMVSSSMPPAKHPPQIRPRVAKSPERRYAMTRKVTKNTSAVPKSFCKARHAPQMPVRPMNIHRLRLLNRRSSVAAPAKM